MSKRIYSVSKTIMLLVATCWVTSASADGFYIGAGAYRTDISIDDFDDNDYAPAAFVGYQFLDTNLLMLSGEVGYYDFGDYESNGNKAEGSAITVAGVAYLPLGPFFEVYAKAGIASAKIELKDSGDRQDFDGEDGFGGIGVAFDILDTIDIYAEYLAFDTKLNSKMYGVCVRLDF